MTDLDDTHIPGRRPRVVHQDVQPSAPEYTSWDQARTWPRKYVVNGHEMELFPIGALARAINRRPRTIHAWEYKGWFPAPLLRSPRKAKDGIPGQRLYSRAFIEGVIEIANDEGIIDEWSANICATDFVERVFELFEETGG